MCAEEEEEGRQQVPLRRRRRTAGDDAVGPAKESAGAPCGECDQVSRRRSGGRRRKQAGVEVE